ncbi:MAG: Xaa-Pro peptidase family protein [Candidatus Heimdallarchaeum endolithica]|uniref:Xaa-Pro peptidase family protein n=1 Tax=Candidatus Heimdallarchaeum endolithica TaxID=2876572 RepID=A0A9Y1BPC3_9ARCH|nr:MAG: Xaa-Pro peptidase family protein [Candidatus Heimdallarchaeum endolithica]
MSLIKEKVKQAIAILQELNIDMWLTYVRKTSEIRDPSLFFLTENTWLTWQTCFILTKEGKKIVIVGRYDAPDIKKQQIYDEIVSYDLGIKDELLNILERNKPETIAVNYSEDNVAADGLTYGLYLKLRKILEGTPYKDRLISSEKILTALRGRKIPEEVDRIKKAVEISEVGHELLKNNIQLGMTETDLANILKANNEKFGVEYAYPPLINVGPETTIGHGSPSSIITVKHGYLVNVDYGVIYDGYASDIQRLTYVLGEKETSVPLEVKKAFDTCKNAITEAADKIRPGMKGYEIDNIAREYVVSSGYPEFMHALGHQVGINVHDGGCLIGPKWEKYGRSPELKIEKNNIFTLELHVYLEKYGYCSIEEMIKVTENGCVFLTNRQTEPWVVKL